MPLEPGTRLGPYELQTLVGAGGMGEVYKARDTRLGRTVALKVLAGSQPDRDQLRERLNREARAVSRLNHPNICTLHDIGRAGEVDFLVMEFVEGETLASRLRRGAMPLAEALRVGGEIADALARAHAAGIVHRDLKPGNVMLTRAGVKLLDFGIATVSPVAEALDAPTVTRPKTLTAEGAVVGTIQYMAPEQLEGQRADPRTDVFAFGAVLYEMITGRPAFTGSSAASLVAAILNTTPDPPSSLAPGTPRAVDRLVMTCLAKAREDRWQSTVDLQREVRWLTEQETHPTDQPRVVQAGARHATRQFVLTAVGIIAGLAVGAGFMWWRAASAGPAGTEAVRFPIVLPPGDALATVNSRRAGPSLALSPDGSKLVYAVEHDGRTRLMLRSLDQIDPVALPGTEGASAPFFSPDGEWIGFVAGQKLKKIATGGGAPLVLASVPPVTRGASWAPDGTIYLSRSFSSGISKVSDDGTVKPVTTLDQGEANHLLPYVLPGGRAVLFTVWNGGSFDEASVWAWSPSTGRRTKLLDSASGAQYVSTGDLVFAKGNALLAVPFDPVKLERTGSPVSVATDVEINPSNGTAEFAVAPTGTLVYATRAAASGADLVWVDRHGVEEPVAGVHGDFVAARLSPLDDRHVALQSLNDIWTCDLTTGALQRLTFAGVNQYPVWTPDGTHVAFSRPAALASPTVSLPTLFWTPADSSGGAERLTTDGGVSFPSDWSPDGTALAFAHNSGTGGDDWDIQVWRPSNHAISTIEHTSFNEMQPAFSPDGRWLAYTSDSSGRQQVYVRPYPGQGIHLQVSPDGGAEPRWGPDGKELFYMRDRSLMRVAIQTTPALGASKPEELFEGPYRRSIGSPGFTSFSVSSDGKRFLMIKPVVAGSAVTRLTVVLGKDWIDRVQHGPG